MTDENIKREYNAKKNARSDKRRTFVGNILFKRTMITLFLIILQLFLLIYMVYQLMHNSPEIIALFYLLSIICTIYIININMKEEFKIAWIIPVCFAPVFGVFMYIFVLVNPGGISLRRKFIKKAQNILPFIEEEKARTDWIAGENQHIGPLVHYLYYTSGYPAYTGTDVTYFPIGEAFFDDVVEKLRSAKSFIFMEFFIVNEGIMWDSILEILKEKVKEGVEVRFMFDGTCAVTTVPYHYDRQLCEFGIKAKMFSPITPLVSTHQNNRDHRKILVIDGQMVYTGGVNLADEYINAYEKYGHWKDIAVRLDGPAVASFTAMFLNLWNLSEIAEDRYDKYIKVAVTQTASEGYVIPYGDDALNHEDVAENVYLDILNRAHKYVYIMTPYFIVDSEMVSAITFAAKRGIDVRIILPHIPDKKIAFMIARTYYPVLLGAGVKVYEYTPGFVHAKLFVSDDIKACIGSVNLDYRSLYHHFECGAFIYDCNAISDMYQDFIDTQANCIEVTLDYYRNLNIFTKLIGRVARIVAPLL